MTAHLPATRAWLLRQLQLECSACVGLGYLPCPCDTVQHHDCTCPLWECPECEGTGGPDFDGGLGPHSRPPAPAGPAVDPSQKDEAPGPVRPSASTPSDTEGA